MVEWQNREKTMNLSVLQRISWYNFVYFSLIYVFPPSERVLWSFVIMERIPISRPFDKFHPVVYLVTYLDIMNIINGKIKCIYLPLTFSTISCIRIGS